MTFVLTTDRALKRGRSCFNFKSLATAERVARFLPGVHVLADWEFNLLKGTV